MRSDARGTYPLCPGTTRSSPYMRLLHRRRPHRVLGRGQIACAEKVIPQSTSQIASSLAANSSTCGMARPTLMHLVVPGHTVFAPRADCPELCTAHRPTCHVRGHEHRPCRAMWPPRSPAHTGFVSSHRRTPCAYSHRCHSATRAAVLDV